MASSDLFELSSYLIRRKVLKVLGGAFHVYDDQEQVVGYSKQKAFKLKEDIRVYADESESQEILLIQARQVVDFSAAYDIVDSESGSLVGTARRKGLKSLVRDSWELLDADGKRIGELKEDSAAMALVRRFINVIPQTFHLGSGSSGVEFKQRFNPLVYKLQVSIRSKCDIDRRLIFGLAVLLAAIEGRQQN